MSFFGREKTEINEKETTFGTRFTTQVWQMLQSVIFTLCVVFPTAPCWFTVEPPPCDHSCTCCVLPVYCRQRRRRRRHRKRRRHNGTVSYTLDVAAIYKGEPELGDSQEISFTTADDDAACGVSLDEGDEYLIDLYQTDDGLTAGSCGLVAKWNSVSDEDKASVETGCEDDPCDVVCGEFQVRGKQREGSRNIRVVKPLDRGAVVSVSWIPRSGSVRRLPSVNRTESWSNSCWGVCFVDKRYRHEPLTCYTVTIIRCRVGVWEALESFARALKKQTIWECKNNRFKSAGYVTRIIAAHPPACSSPFDA